MSNCRTCKYFDGHTCRKTGFDTHHSNMCDMHEPKQEEKQMKDYIVEKHEVKLDDQWWDIEPFVDTVDKIMFSDPRPQITPTPAPAPCAPTPCAPTPCAPVSGAIIVSHLMIYKSDPYYRTSRTMRVVLNKNMQIVTSFNPNDAVSPALEVDQQYATVVFD